MWLMITALTVTPPVSAPATGAASPHYLNCSTVETPQGNVIIDRLPYLVFETGSASITPQGAATLESFVRGYDAPSHCEMVIEGHTDRVGSVAQNLRLAERRATAVAAYLRQKGVTAPIVINPRGEARPLVETADEVAEPQNRYVMIWINDPAQPPR